MARFLYASLGIVAGFVVPFVWLLFRAYSTRREWWEKWLRLEFKKNDQVYLVLSIIAVGLFSLIGYFIGRLKDEAQAESLRVLDTNVELSELASTDGLTGLFNNRYIHERLEVEIQNAFRSPLTCLLVDIDHFKKINDTYGHPFGDEVLIVVAGLLKNAVRGADAVGRLGGEEFLILLPHTPGDRALIVAERIRVEVESHPFSCNDRPVKATVSLGVVSYPSPALQNKEALLKAVDQALYAAKKSGRNQIVIWKDA